MMSDDRLDPERVLATVKRLAALIEKDRQGRISEAQTVAKYVLPLLKAVGWDLEDDRVVMEYRVTSGGKVDLALIDEDEPEVFVEAKRLGESLSLSDAEAKQALSYAYEDGAHWCILTNGDRYEVYDPRRPVAQTKKRVVAFSLTEAAQDPQLISLPLCLLSHRDVTKGGLRAFATRQFATDSLGDLLSNPPAAVMGAISQALSKYELPSEAIREALVSFAGGSPPPPSPAAQPHPSGEGATPKPHPGGEKPGKGTMSFVPPLTISNDHLYVSKHRAKKGGVESWRLPLETVHRVAACAADLHSKGQEFDVGAIRESGRGLNWDQVRRGLGMLWVAGLLEHTHGVMPAYYRLRSPLTADEIMEAVVAAAQPHKMK